MKKILTLSLIALCCLSFLQKKDTDPQKYRAAIVKAAGLKKTTVYVAKDSTATLDDTSNLQLLKVITYNPSGYMKEETIYDTSGQIYLYKYAYQADTLMINRSTLRDGQLQNYTLCEYREDGQMKTETHYNRFGVKTLVSTHYYDKNNQRTKSTVKAKRRRNRKTRYAYDELGQLIKIERNGKTTLRDIHPNGYVFRSWEINGAGSKQPLAIHDYDALDRCVSHTYYYSQSRKDIIASGKINFEEGDEYRSDRLFMKNNLVLQTKEYLNDKFHALVLYQYEYH